MARNNNVQDFVKDVADAVRYKTNSSNLINPQDIPEIIRDLETGQGNAYVDIFDNGDGTQVVYIDGDVYADNTLPINEVYVNGESIPLYQESGGGGSGEDRFKLFIQNELTEVKAEDFGETTRVTAYQFYNKSNIEKITMPETIKYIDTYAFYGTGIKHIDLPENIETIYSDAFRNCANLESFTIPSKVTNLTMRTLANCTSLKSITIPENITTIGSSVLQDCSGLTEINYNATNISSISSSNYITQGAGLNSTGIIVNIGANVKQIPDYLFNPYSSTTTASYLNNITKVNFTEDSVCTRIGGYAFKHCQKMTSINLPETITSIDGYAFDGCSGLTSITIPSKVTTINNYLFQNCSNLTTINLPSGVTSIGNYAFYGCKALPSVNLPSGITSIGANAFYSCEKLQSITLPNNLTTIGNYAFGYCKGLTSITIPSGVTSIGSCAFASCTTLETAYIYPTSSTTKANSSSGGWFYNAKSGLIIHAPSSLNATTSKTAFGNYWNYRTSSATHTTYYDL